ncbi:MAG: metallophosphoesterase [Candidatus Aenigmarchaeota archaeon]|nr:metallophosphoesterase [Candidatus Aenigmarchaeota archaeon]
MSVKFVLNEPAAYLDDINSLVIGDLHIGIEYELGKKGISLPRQINGMLNRIEKLMEKTKAKHLIILGDVKHQVPGISSFEEREILNFFENLREKIKISVCLGNHDTFLKKFLPKDIKLYGSKGFKIKNYGFFHGHARPNENLFKCRYLITSHIHPTLLFKDKFGHKIVEPVWIKCKLDERKIKVKYNIKSGRLEMIIIPTFNRLLSGANINVSNIKHEFIEPLMKDFIVDAEFYLLDGTYVGRLDDFD